MKYGEIIVRRLLAIPHAAYWGLASLAVVALILLLAIPENLCITGLNSLDEAVEYARTMPELPPMGNTNLVRPDYDSFYRDTNPGYFARKWRAVACCLNIPTRFTWPTTYFSSLLGVMLNRVKSYRVERNIVYKMAPSAHARLVVFGDLYGAYHSLVRDLQKLQELKIIDGSLKIIAPETYIVFMGSTMSRSPYGMETLGLILRLMEMNADTVIYLRGNHEDNKYWEAFGLKEQYEIKYPEKAEEIIAATNNFFMHLPLGLYLTVPGCQGRFVRFSHLAGSESSKLKEQIYSHFLEAKQNGILDKYQINESVVHNSKIVVDVAFQSEKKRQTFQASTGLRQLPADAGATTWTLMSAPTLVMQKGLQFIYDAFAIIQLASERKDWVITEYSQNAVKKDGFKSRAYQFYTGARENEKQDLPEPHETVSAVSEAATVPVLTPPATVAKSLDIEKAINSNLVQLLAGRRKRQANPPATQIHQKASALHKPGEESRSPQASVTMPLAPLSALAPIAVGGGEMSITVGSPIQDAATHTMTLPLSVTIKNPTTTQAPRHENTNQNNQDLPLIKVPAG